MESYSSLSDGIIQTLRDGFIGFTWTTVVAILVVFCIATRNITALQSHSGTTDTGGSRPVRMTPYWFPWLGHSLSIAWHQTSCIKNARNYMKEPVFGITLSGTKHNVVASPSMAKSVFAFPGASSSPFVTRVLERGFGDLDGAVRNMNPTNLHVHHKNVFNMFLRESFFAEASTISIRRIEIETPNLVTFSRSIVDQVPWERACEVTMDDGDQTTCKADLFALVRNFAGHITTAGFMGHVIFEAFPHLLEDLWALDSGFTNISKGAPHWLPNPSVSAGYAARDKLLKALAAFHEAFVAWDDGKDPGFDFRDLDDVSESVKQRVRELHKSGLSSAASAPAHLSLLWAMNASTANIVFWNLLRIYAEPTLLEDIRKEIAPYAKGFRPSREETGFPFEERPQLSIDPEGLINSCPLLKASFYECLRLDTTGFSFRELDSDLTLTESKEDAAIDGLAHPREYKLSKGESVVIPHGALQNDTRYVSNPSQYDPSRFITTDPDMGSKRADIHTIKLSDDGVSGCRGRIIAERDNLAFIAGIVSLWNIEPTRGKQLKVPGHRPTTGSFLPKKDLRVKMRLRV